MSGHGWPTREEYTMLICCVTKYLFYVICVLLQQYDAGCWSITYIVMLIKIIPTASLWHYLNIGIGEYVYLEFWNCMNVHRKLQSCMFNQWKIRIWTICSRNDVYYGLTTSNINFHGGTYVMIVFGTVSDFPYIYDDRGYVN